MRETLRVAIILIGTSITGNRLVVLRLLLIAHNPPQCRAKKIKQTGRTIRVKEIVVNSGGTAVLDWLIWSNVINL